MAQSQAVASSEAPRPLIAGRLGPLRGDIRDPRFQSFLLLWVGFTVAPILFGVDKFFNWMTYWPNYLWIGFPHFFWNVSPQNFMYFVGAVEIAAGVLVFLVPRVAPLVVTGWLGGIITNLVIISWTHGGHTTGVYWDIALRDFGLMLAALALFRLAATYAPNPLRRGKARASVGQGDAGPVSAPHAA
jgi:hypothetical protein